MADSRLGGDDRIDKNREIRPCLGIDVLGGCSGREMSTGRETHNTDLLDTPFRSVMTAVAEYVLHIVQRYVPMTERQSVFKHSRADSLTVEPFCGILPFVHVGCEPVGAARTDDDHFPVRVLGEIKLEPRAVSGKFQIHILGQFLRLSAAVGLAGTERDAFDALIYILAFRVQIDNLVRLACELLTGDFRQLFLAVHAFKLLTKPSFQSCRELRPTGTEPVLADFRIKADAEVGESPAVTPLRIDVELCRNLVPDKSLIELD